MNNELAMPPGGGHGVTIILIAPGKPSMPPGHSLDVGSHADLQGPAEDMTDMAPPPRPKKRPMNNERGFSGKRQVMRPRGL